MPPSRPPSSCPKVPNVACRPVLSVRRGGGDHRCVTSIEGDAGQRAGPPGAERHAPSSWRGTIAVVACVWVPVVLGLWISSWAFSAPENGSGLPFLVLVAVATLALVTLFAFVGIRRLAAELRTLRVAAVVLPTAYVIVVQVVLYILEIHSAVSDVGEQAIATVVLSGGAVPFSVFVFRTFTRLRNDLADRATHLERLHERSTAVARGVSRTELGRLIVEGARAIARADRAFLELSPAGAEPGLVAASPDAGRGPAAHEARLLRTAAVSGRRERPGPGDGAALAAPLLRGGEPAGAIVVSRDSGPIFGAEDELLLDMFAVAASAGLENAHRLEEAQMLATVEERERIARDLHDDLGQLLGFLTAKVQAVQELVARGREEQAQRELAGLEGASRMLGTQVREAILGLRARVGPGRPLGEALSEYVADFGVLAGLEATFEGPRDAGRELPGPEQYQVLRIAQEAMSNARRHAAARRVVVRLAVDVEGLDLTVADDGVGFAPGTQPGGFGLKTMAERARALGGVVAVESSPGAGTVVRARIPHREEVRTT